MHKVYVVGGKYSTVGDALIFMVQERIIAAKGYCFVSNIKEASLVIIGGGGTLYSRERDNDQTFKDKKYDFPLGDLLVCREKGIPIVVCGAGWQEFQGTDNLAAWIEILRYANYISVRDQASKEELLKLLKRDIDVFPDVAFAKEIPVLTSPTLPDTIAVSIGKGIDDTRREHISKLLEGLSSKYTFRWMPFDLDEHVEYKRYWIPKFGGTLAIDERWEGKFIPNTSACFGTIQACRGVISTRLHALIMSILANRPILHLSKHNWKVEAQVRDIFKGKGYRYLINTHDNAAENLKKAFECFEDKEVIETFKKIQLENRLLARKHFDHL